MKEEEKFLVLTDVCSRLPYKPYVKVWLREGDTEQGFLTIEDDYDAVLRGFVDGDITKIKPYLRPMSSMTEEERKEYTSYCFEQPFLQKDKTPNLGSVPMCIDWLNKNMFDYRGLIEKNLALEAPEGMYKNQ